MFGFYYNSFYLEHILFQLDQPFRGEKVLQKIDGNLICQFFVCLFVCLKANVSFVTVIIVTITKSNEFHFSFIRVKII